MLLESSITLLESTYSAGVTHDDCHMTIKIFFIAQATDILTYLFTLSLAAFRPEIGTSTRKENGKKKKKRIQKFSAFYFKDESFFFKLTR